KESYIGKNQRLFTRVIIYRLTEEQILERRKKQSYTESKKGITFSEKSKRLTGINIYVTNTPWEVVPMEQIHDFYSLRWQIEIIF
ncbi:transposase, partial [Bacillus thuringiensis]